MITKEEFKKTLIRLWDSVRDEHKGADTCDGVHCNKCPLEKACSHKLISAFNSFELIESVEQWGKEHPFVTNREKFKEVFGFELRENDNGCDGFKCTYKGNCKDCPNYGFWDREYEGE